jgi:hypothetical protein
MWPHGSAAGEGKGNAQWSISCCGKKLRQETCSITLGYAWIDVRPSITAAAPGGRIPIPIQASRAKAGTLAESLGKAKGKAQRCSLSASANLLLSLHPPVLVSGNTHRWIRILSYYSTLHRFPVPYL